MEYKDILLKRAELLEEAANALGELYDEDCILSEAYLMSRKNNEWDYSGLDNARNWPKYKNDKDAYYKDVNKLINSNYKQEKELKAKAEQRNLEEKDFKEKLKKFDAGKNVFSEAVEVLEEGARKYGSKIINEVDKLNNNDEVGDFLLGFMDKDEAQRAYKRYIAKCNELIAEVRKIPNDTWFDRYLNSNDVRKTTGTTTHEFGSSMGDNDSMIMSTRQSYDTAAYNASKENKRFTKEKCIKAIENLKNKIDAAYKKYYKKDETLSESVDYLWN